MPQLRIEPNQRVRLINAPAGFDGVQSVGSEPFDVVLLFAARRSELERSAPAAIAALKSGAKLWVAYPKPGSVPAADLSRDHGWGVGCAVRHPEDLGRPLAQLLIDPLRLRDKGGPVQTDAGALDSNEDWDERQLDRGVDLLELFLLQEVAEQRRQLSGDIRPLARVVDRSFDRHVRQRQRAAGHIQPAILGQPNLQRPQRRVSRLGDTLQRQNR